MNDIKSAFEHIRAEDNLKSDTMQFLYGEIQKRNTRCSRTAKKKYIFRYAAAFIFAIVTLISGAVAYNIYTTPTAYVDVDVNPSFELILNRFDRVIGICVYNGDIDETGLFDVKNKSCGEALDIIMQFAESKGYLQDDTLISVTLQTDNKNRESAMLIGIQDGIESYMSEHHSIAEVDVFPVSGEIRNYSYEQGVSPAKYLAIQELIEVDSTASVESCRSHSISEIKQLTREHGNHHGITQQPSNETPEQEPTSIKTHGGHHGKGNK